MNNIRTLLLNNIAVVHTNVVVDVNGFYFDTKDLGFKFYSVREIRKCSEVYCHLNHEHIPNARPTGYIDENGLAKIILRMQ